MKKLTSLQKLLAHNEINKTEHDRLKEMINSNDIELRDLGFMAVSYHWNKFLRTRVVILPKGTSDIRIMKY